MTPPALRVFVYGTLKQGGRHHAAHCADALRIRTGCAQGRLVDLAAGYPTLHVPESSVLAIGTADLAADAWRGMHCTLPGAPSAAAFIAPHPPCGLVRGEVIDFPDATPALRRLDALVEFTPDGISLYLRVLLPVFVGDLLMPCWTYVSPIASTLPSTRDYHH